MYLLIILRNLHWQNIQHHILPTSVMYVSVDRNDCDGDQPVGTLAQIFSFAMFWLDVLDRRVSWYW